MEMRLGDWYRAAEVEPQHETLVKRQSGIDAYTEAVVDEKVVDLARFFFGIASDEGSVNELQKAIVESDNAFATQNNEIEMRVVAGACLANLIRIGKSNKSLVAGFALVCPALLGRRTVLIPDICEQANIFLNYRSEELRSSPNFHSERITSQEVDAALENFKKVAANDINVAVPALTDLIEKILRPIASLSETSHRLERNQVLFREDSEVLWWLFGEWSRDLQVPLAKVNATGVSMLIAKEMADLTHIPPGPYAAQGVLNYSLKRLGVSNSETTLSTFINKSPIEWRKNWSTSVSARDHSLSLCPVTSAARQSVIVQGGTKWHSSFEALTGVSPNIKLTPAQLSFQLYRECMFLKVVGA